MTTPKTTLLIIPALLLAVATVPAVEHEGGIGFLVAEPTGDFGAIVDDEALGISLHYGVRPVRSLTIGLGGHAMTYGSESTRQDLPLVDDFELTTTNNMGGGFVFAQWRPIDGPVQPYAEARAGLTYLWTESKLEDDDWWGWGEVARETNHDDLTTNWSAGGGLLIRLCGGNEFERKPAVYLDLGVTHTRGGEAEYLTEGAIEVVDDAAVFAPSESRTDMTTYEVGVVLVFP
ncbi:hypothetical protein GF314_12105 [bacterium]|nr:hypothetical protein [bacterium]